MTSVPVSIEGDRLALNMSTSAAGSAVVEILDESGAPMSGFSAADCDELYGDDIERIVTWNGLADLSRVKGQTVKLKIILADADVYSISSV